MVIGNKLKLLPHIILCIWKLTKAQMWIIDALYVAHGLPIKNMWPNPYKTNPCVLLQVLLDHSPQGTIGLYGGICFAAALAISLLPIETKGKTMVVSINTILLSRVIHRAFITLKKNHFYLKLSQKWAKAWIWGGGGGWGIGVQVVHIQVHPLEVQHPIKIFHLKV